MAHKLIWSAEASADLDGIFTYIAKDSEAIAGRAIQRILRAVDDLAVFPMAGPRVREWKRSPYRSLVVPPHRVIYRAERQGVFIIAIAHGAQDLKKLMKIRKRPR